MDPDGNARPTDGDDNGEALPDMGVYEFQPGPVTPGYVDLSGSLDLADVLRALQIVAGSSGFTVSPEADVDGDNKIGLEEAIYGLQTLAD